MNKSTYFICLLGIFLCFTAQAVFQFSVSTMIDIVFAALILGFILSFKKVKPGQKGVVILHGPFVGGKKIPLTEEEFTVLFLGKTHLRIISKMGYTLNFKK